MSDSTIEGSAPLPPTPTGYLTPVAALNMPPGSPVIARASDGKAALAKADSDTTAAVIGLLARPATANQNTLVYYAGVLTLTEAQWNAIETGATTGLTPNATYYLSDATAGKLTRTPVSTGGHRVASIGVALSTTQLLITAISGVDHV